MQGISFTEVFTETITAEQKSFAHDLEFVSCFVQQMNNVLLVASETKELRLLLQDSIGQTQKRVIKKPFCFKFYYDPLRII